MRSRNKAILISSAILLLLFAGFLALRMPGNNQITSGTFLENKPFISNSENVGIEVHMCAIEPCDSELANFIRQANGTLDCALYELSNQKVIDAVNSSKAKIRLVIDRHEVRRKNNFSFVRPAKNTALMHNKFCIAGGNKVMTGSYNPANNAGDDNNMLIINSSNLARNYEAEFQELWDGTKGTALASKPIVFGNSTMTSYFCPEDDCSGKVIDEIRKANGSIYFMAYSFTHPEIATDLVLRFQNEVEVKGVMEKQQENNFTKYNLFKTQGIDVRWDGNKNLMHHKVFIIDNRTVITGSFNPTRNGDENNDENVLIIKDSEIAKIYLKEFERVREET